MAASGSGMNLQLEIKMPGLDQGSARTIPRSFLERQTMPRINVRRTQARRITNSHFRFIRQIGSGNTWNHSLEVD
jgi:hypothetical protein